ncbi:serine/threonine-protein kinase Nek3-like [Haliotis rubra]|uniref:serine/threonine-protein kinase Nek3-like n=1 Tax=Haliotis rubra TaxID=36100 RepID=UPI001EE581D3|nr:serine/threonine-protein kinase Nek3-like [Haliotis rubra]
MVDYQVESDGLTDKVIGTGCSGKVYAATLTLSPRQSREIAVKEIFMNMRSQGNIVNETRISLYLEPTGYVPICYGLVKDEKGRYSIVLEFFGSGQTLRAIFNTKKSLPKIHWLHIACQLVDGLGKIHDKDVIINDIKPDNILVDLSGTLPKVKYCDMGSASYKTGVTFDEGQDMKNFIYIAPEVCTYAQTTKASDVFSLGKVFQNIHSCSQINTMLVLYNMCSAKTPADRPDLSCLRRMLQEEYTKEVLSQTEEARGYLDPSEQEPEPQGFVIKDSESPGNKGSPHAGNVSLGNEASEVESGNTGENAAPDNHTQGAVPSTIRYVTNTKSTFANSGVSTAHELSACTQKMHPTDAEFSAIQQTCDGTKDDCSLPTITVEAAAITENQNKPAPAPKTDESQVTRPTSSLVKEDQGMFSKANSEDHTVSSPIATESAAPLLAHGLSATKMKEAPANQDWSAPAPSSALQQAVYPNAIASEANVFEKPSELTFSDVFYFLGLLIMLAYRILWTTDVNVP